MAVLGAQRVDTLRKTIQDLLNAIGPDSVINTLELRNNPNLPKRYWQSDFFDGRIRQVYNLGCLDFNVFDDNTTLAQKLEACLNYLYAPSQAPVELHDWIAATSLSKAPALFTQINGGVRDRLDDVENLDAYEPKAFEALKRLIEIQLAYNVIEMIGNPADHPLNEAQVAAFAAQTLNQPIADFAALKSALEALIQQKATFSVQDNIRFRMQKALAHSLSGHGNSSQGNKQYWFGSLYDEGREGIEKTIDLIERSEVAPGHRVEVIKAGLGNIALRNAVYPLIAFQKGLAYLKDLSTLPFRGLRAVTADIPRLGRVMDFTTRGGSRYTRNLIGKAPVLILSVLALLEMNRWFNNESALLTNNPIEEMMLELSPWLVHLFEAYGIAVGAQTVINALALIEKTVMPKAFSQDIKQILINENVQQFIDSALTDDSIFVHGSEVLRLPIYLPEPVMQLLTKIEREEVAVQIAIQRQAEYVKKVPNHPIQQPVMWGSDLKWTPSYTPLRAGQTQPTVLLPPPPGPNDDDLMAELIARARLG